MNPSEMVDTLDYKDQRSASVILGTEKEQLQHPLSLQCKEQRPSVQCGRQQLSAHSGKQHSSAQSSKVLCPSGLQNGEQLWQSVTQRGEPAGPSRIVRRKQSATAG